MFMANRNILYIAVLLCFFFTSCTETINIDVPLHKPQIVIGSIFTADSAMTVYVGKTASMAGQETPIVENAKVILKSSKGEEEELTYTHNGYYRSELILSEKVRYSIEVQVDGFSRVYATDSIPAIVKIDSTFQKNSNYFDNDIQSYLSTVNVSFTDPSNINYYELYQQRMDTMHVRIDLHSIDTTYYISNTYMTTDYFAVEAENNEIYKNHEVKFILFSDKLLERCVSFDIYSGVYSISYSALILRNVSENYYYYKRSWLRHKYNQEMIGYSQFEDLANSFFTANPTELYSNVENGLGIFAGYASHMFEITKTDKN